MTIGEPQKVWQVEPLEEPEPLRQPAEIPAEPVPQPQEDPERVGA